ncbi:MAG: hypothetical protein IKX44_00225 [Prevotella sp.]|nr:hypothetical protein [Prevotella sp.]
MRKILVAVGLSVFCHILWAQIDRHDVVNRNCPLVDRLDALQALTVGNGGFAFTVDGTGLQTFPEMYEQGVPLGTMSDWGWHSFPNTEGYSSAKALQNFDFGRGRLEPYSVENKTDQRSRDAANYLRANPHRLHLGTIGYDIPLSDTARVHVENQRLDLWNGWIESVFNYKKARYYCVTFVHPERDIVYSSYMTDDERPLPVKLRFPYPTGKHSDAACDWTPGMANNKTEIVQQTDSSVLLCRTIDNTVYFVRLHWIGEADFEKKADNSFTLTPKQAGLTFSCEYSQQKPVAEYISNEIALEQTKHHWREYWKKGGIVDFSHCKDPRAKELERRVVLSQYLLAVNCAGDTPPQETGLTYNSWFGKFHLEMIWWHQAQFALWGHPELLEHTLDWYFRAVPKAREIAQRQGFEGLRWMKMTDPSAEEAPSKVGSFLIWQQPHLIYLAELLHQAGTNISMKYQQLVQETAEFMFSFATYDTLHDRYTLNNIIPAQETLRAAETINPPFELSYWHFGIQLAQLWRQRASLPPVPEWNKLIERLSPLAFNSDSLYLAAETAPDTYNNSRYTSDHPAVLGAVGMLPLSKQINPATMKKTLDWILNNWNWEKTWGWDFPMVAMCAARLGEPQKAVDALLMDKRTNTYLVSGHNYQDQRLRIYLPGNGGLLTAIALMCAGWDGSEEPCPGFPKDGNWDVRWEGLLPLP